MMENLRTYGTAPFIAAVIHGGPGAAGEMAPVARELSLRCGILEPLQTAASIDGQIRELREILRQHAELPAVLIGHSWGAWLAYMLAARHPECVRKLILAGSGPFEHKYVQLMNETIAHRLSAAENKEVDRLKESLENPGEENKSEILLRFGELMSKTASYKTISLHNETTEVRPEIFLPVMEEALLIRSSGRLLAMGGGIQCPVLAIHGDYDPHPYKGVSEPLSRVIKNFRFVLLKDCGHVPWNEEKARKQFFSILEKEISI